MRTINIETIRFDTTSESNQCKNYPNSGLFMVKVANGTNDLVFVDGRQEYVIYVCPENVFNNIFAIKKTSDSVEELKPSNELIQESIKYDGDFILEFARILLNRK